ncbi:MAG: glycosyl hydrolase family 18 protein [Enterobacteriaceae bacterium]
MDYAYEADVANQNYADLMTYKNDNPQTRLIASIGGWAYGPRFHQFAKDADYNTASAVAQNFLNSCEQLLRGKAPYPTFDGIDIDWEYPGYGQSESVLYPQEFAFFTALMQQLHARVEKVNQEMHSDKILSVAVPINLAKLNGDGQLHWKQLGGYFDLINLMGFDAHAEFDAKGPVQAAMDQAPADEILAAVHSLQQQGVNSQKIILGIPNYTREMLVQSKPTAANNYTYGVKGEMNPQKIGLPLYYPDTTFSDPPNVVPYYPSGGAVDNTGVYGYSCVVSALTQGAHGSDTCWQPSQIPAATDNRGLFGQPLPTDFSVTTIPGIDGVDHAWGYSLSQSVIQSPPAGNQVPIPQIYYKAYPVFSYDSPEVLKQKIDHIVKANNLGGVWFWDIHNDTYHDQDAQYSLYLTAVQALRGN